MQLSKRSWNTLPKLLTLLPVVSLMKEDSLNSKPFLKSWTGGKKVYQSIWTQRDLFSQGFTFCPMTIYWPFWVHRIQKQSSPTCSNFSITVSNSSCPKANKSKVWSLTKEKSSPSKIWSNQKTVQCKFG